MTHGFMGKHALFLATTEVSLLSNNVQKNSRSAKIRGAVELAGGAALAALIGTGFVTANLTWLVIVAAIVGVFTLLKGYILEYSYETDEDGNITGPIPIPLEGIIHCSMILSWIVGFFFTKTYGPWVTFPYALTGVAGLTGQSVSDAKTTKVIDADGRERQQVDGENQWAAFTNAEHPTAMKVFLAGFTGLGVLVAVPLLLPAAVVIPPAALVGAGWMVFGLMCAGVLGGAFSAVTEKFVYTGSRVGVSVKRIFAERDRRIKRAHAIGRTDPSQTNTSSDAAQSDTQVRLAEAITKSTSRAVRVKRGSRQEGDQPVWWRLPGEAP